LAEGTKDSNFVKNWLGVIHQFMESARNTPAPDDYKWLDHFEVFDFLNFTPQLENWFLERLLANCEKETPMGIFSCEKYRQILDKNALKLSEQDHK
jgi:hypothetical protein